MFCYVIDWVSITNFKWLVHTEFGNVDLLSSSVPMFLSLKDVLFFLQLNLIFCIIFIYALKKEVDLWLYVCLPFFFSFYPPQKRSRTAVKLQHQICLIVKYSVSLFLKWLSWGTDNINDNNNQEDFYIFNFYIEKN